MDIIVFKDRFKLEHESRFTVEVLKRSFFVVNGMCAGNNIDK